MAQIDKVRPTNDINLNLLGDASFFSDNYERLFLINPDRFFITGDLGFGYTEEFHLCIFGPCSSPVSDITIPHRITGNLGWKRNFFEFGLGGTLISTTTPAHYFLYPIVGYRLQPLKSDRVNFRIFAEYPLPGFRSEYLIFIPVGWSVGYCF